MHNRVSTSKKTGKTTLLRSILIAIAIVFFSVSFIIAGSSAENNLNISTDNITKSSYVEIPTQEDVQDSPTKEIPSDPLQILLEYKNDSIYDSDNDGIDLIDPHKNEIGVDFTVAKSNISHELDYDYLCTKWETRSYDTDTSFSACYGSLFSCQAIGYQQGKTEWNETFYSIYDGGLVTKNNSIGAQLFYVVPGENNTFEEVIYSKKAYLPAIYVDPAEVKPVLDLSNYEYDLSTDKEEYYYGEIVYIYFTFSEVEQVNMFVIDDGFNTYHIMDPSDENVFIPMGIGNYTAYANISIGGLSALLDSQFLVLGDEEYYSQFGLLKTDKDVYYDEETVTLLFSDNVTEVINVEVTRGYVTYTPFNESDYAHEMIMFPFVYGDYKITADVVYNGRTVPVSTEFVYVKEKPRLSDELTINKAEEDSVILTWPENTDAESYTIYYSSDLSQIENLNPENVGEDVVVIDVIESLNWTDDIAEEVDERYYRLATITQDSEILTQVSVGKYEIEILEATGIPGQGLEKNTVVLPLIPTNNSVSEVIEGVSDFDILYNYDSRTGIYYQSQYFSDYGWYGGINELEQGVEYEFRPVKSSYKFTIVGEVPRGTVHDE